MAFFRPFSEVFCCFTYDVIVFFDMSSSYIDYLTTVF